MKIELFAFDLDGTLLDTAPDFLHAVNLLRKKDIQTLPSTIELELQINPFLRCSQPEVIKSAEKYSGSQLSSPSEVLGSIRDWKDNF